MYHVGVIGLGKIAAMYGNPDEQAPYCHVGGIRFSKRVQLVSVADASGPARDAFRQRWDGSFPELKHFNTMGEMLAERRLDVLAICVRGPAHFAVLMEAIQHPQAPRAIFLEKPPTCSLAEMDQAVAAARARSIPITVSYSRHWAPHVLRLSELVRSGLIGQVQQVIGYSGGGVLSFSSHTTDLICQFAGYDPVAVFARGKSTPDPKLPPGYEPEPEIHSMIIEFASGVRALHAASGEHGGLYCEVFGTQGYVRAGMYLPPVAKDKDGKPIDLSQHAMPANASVFTVAYDQIAAQLDGGTPAACTDRDWHTVNELGYAAIESILTAQRVTLPNANRRRRIYANG